MELTDNRQWNRRFARSGISRQ